MFLGKLTTDEYREDYPQLCHIQVTAVNFYREMILETLMQFPTWLPFPQAVFEDMRNAYTNSDNSNDSNFFCCDIPYQGKSYYLIGRIQVVENTPFYYLKVDHSRDSSLP